MKFILLALCVLSLSPAYGRLFGRRSHSQSNHHSNHYSGNSHASYSQGTGNPMELLGLINNYRAANGRGPLSYDPRLNMADGPGHSNFKNSGMSGCTNWSGSKNSYTTFNMWKASGGHNTNMLRSNITRVGFSYGNGTTMTAQ